MKILLINPPHTLAYPQIPKIGWPLGLAYIASVLREENHDVKILDAFAEDFTQAKFIKNNLIKYGLSWENIKHKISQLSPDIVGISDLFITQSPNAHKIANITKEIDPEIITIIGGAYPSSKPEESMKDENVDFIVIGEGELTFKELVKVIEENKALKSIDGIGFRISADEIRINPKKQFIENLDDLPFPSYDLLRLDQYFKATGLGKLKLKAGGKELNLSSRIAQNYRWMTVFTSRGCPFQCIFCTIHPVWGKKWRARSPKNVLSQIRLLAEKYRIKEIQFEDDNLTFDRKRADAIFDGMIQEGFEIVWTTPNGVRIDTLDEKILKKIKRSGCRELTIGVESGDQKVIDQIINKKIKLSHVRTIAKICKKIDLKLIAFYVLGIPSETEENIKKTLRYAIYMWEKYNLLCYFNFADPLPGSRLYQICKSKNFIRDYSPEEYLLANSFYKPKPLIKTKEFSPKLLVKWVSEANELIEMKKRGSMSISYLKLKIENLLGELGLKTNLKLLLHARKKIAYIKHILE